MDPVKPAVIGYIAFHRTHQADVYRGGYRGKIYKTPAYARAAQRAYRESDGAFAARMKIVPVYASDEEVSV
ncbi:MAG TPA: hypothetical protein VNR89_04020 [Roseomonas sp.]|nr:hypothetical protein [Roseomonas sp.]